MLSKKTETESSKIKASIKTFFRVRNCFNVVGDNKIQYHRLVEFVQQITPTKSVFQINISGPILCSMIQTYVSKLQKKSPCIIHNAFTRAVAAESRKIIEKLYINYLENIAEIEVRLPCTEEELWNKHNELSNYLLNRFDEQMNHFSEYEEILNERNTIKYRMQNYYEELKENNFKSSEESSRKIFTKLFDVLKDDEEIVDRVTEIEENLINGVKSYYENSVGPAAYKVFIEEIIIIFPFFCRVIRDITQQVECNQEDLSQEIENLKKNREKARQNEKKLQQILDETVKNYESQLINKDKTINDLQSSCSTRINISDTKVKNLTREFKLIQQELEYSQKEKTAILDTEREIFNQKIIDYEETIEKLKDQVLKLERENEEFQVLHEQSLSAKEDEIIELRQKEKLSMNTAENLEDYSILHGLKHDIAEVFNQFHKDQSANEKIVLQMDKIASLQSELNKYRLKEIESRSKLIDDYEEKINNLQDEIESLTRELNDLRKNKKMIFEDSLEIKVINEQLMQLKNEISRKNEEIFLIMENLNKRDEQIQNLYSVIEVHKKQTETSEIEYQDISDQLHRAKIELTQAKDDNDILLGLMGYSLEIFQKKRNIQAINLGQIQNPGNKSRVIKIFKKFGIPFDS